MNNFFTKTFAKFKNFYKEVQFKKETIPFAFYGKNALFHGIYKSNLELVKYALEHYSYKIEDESTLLGFHKNYTVSEEICTLLLGKGLNPLQNDEHLMRFEFCPPLFRAYLKQGHSFEEIYTGKTAVLKDYGTTYQSVLPKNALIEDLNREYNSKEFVLHQCLFKYYTYQVLKRPLPKKEEDAKKLQEKFISNEMFIAILLEFNFFSSVYFNKIFKPLFLEYGKILFNNEISGEEISNYYLAKEQSKTLNSTVVNPTTTKKITIL